MKLPEETRNLYKNEAEKAFESFEKSHTDKLKDLRMGRDEHDVNIKQYLSQKEVAFMLDIHPQNYNKVETGKLKGGNMITIKHLIKLCTIYGCSANYILGLQESTQRGDSYKELEMLKDKCDVLEEALATERRINEMLERENKKIKEEIEKLKEEIEKL